MTKLKTKHAGLHGKTVNLPGVGKVSIDNNGMTESSIPDEHAIAISENTEDWQLVDEEGNELVVETEGSDSVDETNTEDKDEVDEEVTEEIEEEAEEGLSDEEKAKLRAQFNAMKLKDLLELAAGAGYPIEEYKSKTKVQKAMAAYLYNKAVS